MLHEIFSIKDIKTGTHNPPFYQKNVGEASRTFEKLCNDKTSILNEYPEDFVLLKLGNFCDETGELIASTPSIIGTASQYLKNAKGQLKDPKAPFFTLD
jgi:hypothetical protein